MWQHTSLQTLSFLQIPLQWPRYFPPVGARGPPRDPQNHFAIIIWDDYYTLYIYTLTIFKKQIPQKKNRFKMDTNDLYCFASFQFRQKYEKTLFQMSFQWNLSHGFSGKSYFPASPKCWFMLISEKTTGFVWFIYFFNLILFCLIFYFYLFICLFIFLCQKKGIHEGESR